MTDYSFIVNPNLPVKKVMHAIVSPQYPQVITALKEAGIVPVAVSSCDRVLYPLRNHSDMLFSYLGNGYFAVEQGQRILSQTLKNLGFKCCCDDIQLSQEYPQDIPLNFCIMGEFIICKSDNTPGLFRQRKTVINVKQGYAKCSCVPINENSLITDDFSIYNAAINFGIDALLVKKGSVTLQGFDTGFIGGCCGKLADDILAFCGDITKHSDYMQINSFLRERNVYPYSLFDGDLIDIGSIIPITQHFDCT